MLMAQTASYHTTVQWMGEHHGNVRMGNGPEMEFSAPPDSHGLAGVLTPEDAFVAAVNTCVMLMFIWSAERFRLGLESYECEAEGTKRIELDRTETFTEIVLRPKIVIRQDASGCDRVLKRAQQALQSSLKYSLVANSIKSKLTIEPEIRILS
jgi:organic hydroperoxide reductase OsmC/OhrA